MAAVMEKSEFMEVTIVTELGNAVRINPEDRGEANGPAVEVKNGQTIRVKRVIGNMLVANRQAQPGKVELAKKGK